MAFPQKYPFHSIATMVFTPEPGSPFITSPWLNITSGCLSFNPMVGRNTATILRQIADECDAAWALMDAQNPNRELAVPTGQVNSPEEDAAMDALEPACFGPNVEG